jgi:hypothetical protein
MNNHLLPATKFAPLNFSFSFTVNMVKIVEKIIDVLFLSVSIIHGQVLNQTDSVKYLGLNIH